MLVMLFLFGKNNPKVLRGAKTNRNKAKRFAKQQWSNVINALACVYCYFLNAESNGYQQKRKELHRSVVNRYPSNSHFLE